MTDRGHPVHEVKASLFRVLGHPARVRILELLRDGERSVGCAAGRARARLGRHVAAPRGAAPDRGRRVAARGDERLLPRRRPSVSSICSRPAATIIARRLAEQQSLLRGARDGVTGAVLVAGAGRASRSAAVLRRCAGGFAAGLVAAGGGRARRRGRRVLGCSPTATRSGAAFTSAFDVRARRRRAERLLPRHARRWSRCPRSSSRSRYLEPTARGPGGRACSRRRSCSRSPRVLCARDPLRSSSAGS